MKRIIYIVILIITGSTIIFAFKPEKTARATTKAVVKDSVESVKAFMSVYKVLMSPRCMNCHPAGDSPLQGDDSHAHTMNIKRGVDGKGLYAVRCSNCHQNENTPGMHMPPGNPKWGLPPAKMRMVFQGRTPRQLALQILDTKQNGNRNHKQLIDHMANDELVGWGWHPGEGRTLPPMSRPAFAAQVRLWLAKGAYAPDAKLKAIR